MSDWSHEWGDSPCGECPGTRGLHKTGCPALKRAEVAGKAIKEATAKAAADREAIAKAQDPKMPPLPLADVIELLAKSAKQNADGNVSWRDLEWLAAIVRERGVK